jgi:hypothetical protein
MNVGTSLNDGFNSIVDVMKACCQDTHVCIDAAVGLFLSVESEWILSPRNPFTSLVLPGPNVSTYFWTFPRGYDGAYPDSLLKHVDHV